MTRICRLAAIIVLCFAALAVAGGVGYSEYDPVFWVSLALLVCVFLTYVYRGYRTSEVKRYEVLRLTEDNEREVRGWVETANGPVVAYNLAMSTGLAAPFERIECVKVAT